MVFGEMELEIDISFLLLVIAGLCFYNGLAAGKRPVMPWFTAQVTTAIVRIALRWPSHMEGNCWLF